MDRYADYLRDQLGEDVADLIGGGFTDWEATLRFTLRMAAEQPLLVVLNEAPRLLAGRPDFADLLSAVWESRSAYAASIVNTPTARGSGIGSPCSRMTSR